MQHLESAFTAARNELAHFTASCVACVIDDDAVTVINVGICRAYHRRGDELVQIGGDHAFVHHDAVVARRLLGMHSEEPAVEARVAIAAGDQLVLCTDTVWHAGGPERVMSVAAGSDLPAQPLQDAAAIVVTLE